MLDRSVYGTPIASGNMAFSGFSTRTDETSTVDDLCAAGTVPPHSEVGLVKSCRCVVLIGATRRVYAMMQWLLGYERGRKSAFDVYLNSR